jgi:hypothetical protein
VVQRHPPVLVLRSKQAGVVPNNVLEDGEWMIVFQGHNQRALGVVVVVAHDDRGIGLA